MAKRNKLYYQDEDGHFYEITPAKATEVEQLTLDLDGEGLVDLGQNLPEFSIELDDDESRQMFYALYNPDDIRDTIITYLDDIHSAYLNGVYYVTHADNAKDILKADDITSKDALEKCQKLAETLDLFVEACKNEYLMERDPAFKSFTTSDMN